jgi:hypothetical protein
LPLFQLPPVFHGPDSLDVQTIVPGGGGNGFDCV